MIFGQHYQCISQFKKLKSGRSQLISDCVVFCQRPCQYLNIQCQQVFIYPLDS